MPELWWTVIHCRTFICMISWYPNNKERIMIIEKVDLHVRRFQVINIINFYISRIEWTNYDWKFSFNGNSYNEEKKKLDVSWYGHILGHSRFSSVFSSFFHRQTKQFVVAFINHHWNAFYLHSNRIIPL